MEVNLSRDGYFTLHYLHLHVCQTSIKLLTCIKRPVKPFPKGDPLIQVWPHKPCRYMLPQTVWFLRPFGLKSGFNL